MAQQANTQEEQWFLRTGGDTVFGPVTVEGLVVWAEQGRVLPGHDISTDRKKWVSAVSLPFLKMQWYVDDGAGELRGPLNRAAAEALVKSGKVSENAQIIAADEVDLTENLETPAKPTPDKQVNATQKALSQRIQELELQLNERTQAEPPSKQTRVASQQTQEQEALTVKITELETLCETLKRNAEKDHRATERRAEQLRNQNKKLEEQLEELVTAKNDQVRLTEALAQKSADYEALKKEMALLTETPEASDAKALESKQKCAEITEHLSKARLEIVQWRDECERREKEKREAFSLSEAVERQYGDVLSRTEQMKEDFDRLRIAYDKSVEDTQKAQAKALASESEFAELLDMSNTRDNEYQKKIAELERFTSQTPEKIAQFYADQAALFQLLKRELEVLSQEQESERQHLEQLKQLSSKRLDDLQERKQVLTRQLGNSPADMTRLSAREQTTDPAAARIRTEFDNLRFVHERDMRAAEEREREWVRKFRAAETEANRLRTLAHEGERNSKELQEISEQLHQREHELAEERKVREAERAQAQANHQALVARLESLERTENRNSPETPSEDEKSNKFPQWMRFK